MKEHRESPPASLVQSRRRLRNLGVRPEPSHPRALLKAVMECGQDSFGVDLLDEVARLEGLDPADQMEQVRDWVWMALSARVSDRSANPALIEDLVRYPIRRRRAPESLAVRFGRTRSAVSREGSLLLLVDASTAQRALDDVWDAVDRACLQLGRFPATIEAYRATIDLHAAQARVCRIQDAVGKAAESPESGFRRARVASAGEIEEFLQGGVDLLSARCIAEQGRSVLEVSGRARLRNSKAPLDLGHLKTLHALPSEILESAAPWPAKSIRSPAESKTAHP